MDSIENDSQGLIEYSKESQLEDAIFQDCPEVKEVKKFLDTFKPKEDKYSDGFLAQAYVAARESKTLSMASVRDGLSLDTQTFSYYMKNYPKFAAAVRLGILDAKKALRTELEGSLIKRALGTKIKETKTEETGTIDEDGNMHKALRKTITTEKELPADTNAILELLRKLDPSWNPKASIDVNYSGNVTQDVNVNVDYKMLSPSALRELLNSEAKLVNRDAYKLENGRSVNTLLEERNEDTERILDTFEKVKKEDEIIIEKTEEKPKKKRVMSEETKEKIRQSQKKLWEAKHKGTTDKE